MKRALILTLTLFISILLYAQAPQKMSYQAVVRDGDKRLVANTTIGMQISILQGSAAGTPVYVETQTVKTNENGLISIQVGTGKSNYAFSRINWGSDQFYIKTEIDLDGGSHYTLTGTSQLLSVPYALYAHQSASGLWGQNAESELYYLGGNVGIGAVNPVYQLDVLSTTGDAFTRIKSDQANAGLLIDKNSLSHMARIVYQQNHNNIFHTGLLGNNNYRITTDLTGLNGLEVQQSGKVVFSDNFQMNTGAGQGKVLTSDASGNASWQDASGGNNQTRYLAIPGMAFQNAIQNPTLTSNGSIMALNTTEPDQMEVSYGIVLPDGATITDFEVTLVDNSAQNLQIGLYANDFRADDDLTSMDTEIFIFNSSGASQNYRTFTVDLSGIDPYDLIIDKDKVYYLIASWYHEGTGIKIALSKVLITYTE